MNKLKPDYQADVLVCGGGIAGISAALAAARHGSNTILLEREYMLGGLGTAGLIYVFLPLCDGLGKQVSFGIAEELLKLSVSKDIPENAIAKNWTKEKHTERDARYEVAFNPQMCALLMEKLLIESNVKILYGAYAVDTVCEENKITGVVIESKSGRQLIETKSVVDATGDADIAHFSGVPCKTHETGNILAAWYCYTNNGKYNVRMLGASDTPGQSENLGRLNDDLYSGIDVNENSLFVMQSHKHMLDDFLEKRQKGQAAELATIPTIPQLRMTRKLVGEYVLHDTQQHEYFENSIGMVSDWRKRGPVYEVPFETLYSKNVKNLVCAGRCTSVTDEMWDIMRVIPCCAVTGQAAGTAAALSSDFTTLDIKLLQNALRADGVVIHENEL